MLEAGKKFRHLVQFTSGQPTSDFTYTLYNGAGDTVLTDTVPVAVGQLSYLIEIPAVNNVLTNPLFEQFTLEWSYTTASEAIDGEVKYTLHAAINFPVSEDGVRNLLGVTAEEVPSNEINLFEGYLSFLSIVGEATDLSAYEGAGTFDSFQITKAIEAATALLIFPSIQIRLPKIYDSGTSSYERWTTIDWAALHGELNAKLYAGVEVVDAEIELVPVIDIFVLSDRGTDPTTGA